MTRRIVLAILMISWLALLAAGASTYFITRTLVLADLDETILARIASLPELERPGSLPGAPPDTGDRWVFRNQADHSIHGPAATPSPAATQSAAADAPLTILSADFGELGDGTPLRTLTVRAYLKRSDPLEALFPVTVVYSASAQRMDTLLQRLLYSLAGFGILAAVGTTLVARSVARAALKPMREAVQIIESIDEQSLDQRIDVQRLPPELAPMGQRLNDLLARLEVAFAQRKQFLADASHELRTPVAALVTTLEVGLARRRDPNDYIRTLERCLTDARLLNRLVVSLLEQVRTERFAAAASGAPAGVATARELAPVHLSSVLGQCVEMVRAMAEVKGITLRREIQDVLLLTDEMALRSMVTNLLSNAVEYTPQGGAVTVQATLLPDDRPAAQLPEIPESMPSAPCRLRVRVTDDGPGIPPEHHTGIFEPFYRLDAARAQEHHLGLGLALVQTHAKALGGSCTLESPICTSPSPYGSAFAINIPAIQLKPHSLTPENNTAQAPQSNTIVQEQA